MLKLDFYESGPGETTVVTFPGGGVGVVDACPSADTSRPDIATLVAGKTVHFACLTHPHADHGLDLVRLIEEHETIHAFWHTLSQVDQFFYGITQTPNFPSRDAGLVRDMQTKWANFLIDLFAAITDKSLTVHQLRNDQQPTEIDGVEVHVLCPDEATQNQFTRAYQLLLSNPGADLPDPNLLSAVLALRYGDSLVLLGGDALKRNWDEAARQFRRAALPKAVVLKVPHHGALNALRVNPGRDEKGYLDLCSHSPRVKAVVFPGNSRHPHPKVRVHLDRSTDLFMVASSQASGPVNPLRLGIIDARAVGPATGGSPVVSLQVDRQGGVTVTRGSP